MVIHRYPSPTEMTGMHLPIEGDTPECRTVLNLKGCEETTLTVAPMHQMDRRIRKKAHSGEPAQFAQELAKLHMRLLWAKKVSQKRVR